MNANTEITATKVEGTARHTFLQDKFGNMALPIESRTFNALSNMCAEYQGGYWEFFNLSNGGMYMAPSVEGPLTLVVPTNGFRGAMSADAAGIVASMFAINAQLWNTPTAELDRMYYALYDYALGFHKEASEIARAID